MITLRENKLYKKKSLPSILCVIPMPALSLMFTGMLKVWSEVGFFFSMSLAEVPTQQKAIGFLFVGRSRLNNLTQPFILYIILMAAFVIVYTELSS